MTMKFSKTELLSGQYALLTHAQARAAGLSRATIRNAIKQRRWQVVLPAVYATSNRELTDDDRLYAAVLYGGPSSVITGAAACTRHGLHYVPTDPYVRLAVPATARPSSHAFVRVTCTRRLPEPVLWVPGPASPAVATNMTVPLAPLARAALDSARDVGLEVTRTVPHLSNGRPVLSASGARVHYDHALRAVRALICEAAQPGLASTEDLVRELEEGPRHGSALARRAIDDVVAGCRSAPECELRDLLALSDVLPPAVFNELIPGLRRLRPDACWPVRRLIVEIDSAEWHRRGDAYERTEQRRAYLASQGWIVIPVSPQRLRACPHEVLAEIEAAYLAAPVAA
ncbi:hypothetical protein [Phytoactinopolyspora mesophila]|uniref:DUF559 domain-containing protein n=1 Tax=Phytoactinopolyspora mesophila TaxID=2650750 RepID=A0A7K3M0X5_9ACTN|nr:hypothetical protein [Phytoactinopolyspora mesophila]NDL56951.1 hypothetical protein [Phytoactinopolyspora mesophila]